MDDYVSTKSLVIDSTDCSFGSRIYTLGCGSFEVLNQEVHSEVVAAPFICRLEERQEPSTIGTTKVVVIDPLQQRPRGRTDN